MDNNCSLFGFSRTLSDHTIALAAAVTAREILRFRDFTGILLPATMQLSLDSLLVRCLLPAQKTSCLLAWVQLERSVSHEQLEA